MRHAPRWISAIVPFNEPPGKGPQARPLSPDCVTSRSGAVKTALGFGPSPKSAAMRARFVGTSLPVTRTLAKKMCELVVAPTVIAEGAVPGELMVVIEGNCEPLAQAFHD